jgi:hypothetical protein
MNNPFSTSEIGDMLSKQVLQRSDTYKQVINDPQFSREDVYALGVQHGIWAAQVWYEDRAGEQYGN